MPFIFRYSQAAERNPKLQSIPAELQDNMSCGDRETLTYPSENIQKRSDRTSTAPKAQQDPH